MVMKAFVAAVFRPRAFHLILTSHVPLSRISMCQADRKGPPSGEGGCNFSQENLGRNIPVWLA